MGKTLSESVGTTVREVIVSHDPASAVRHSKFWYTKMTCFWRRQTELDVRIPDHATFHSVHTD